MPTIEHAWSSFTAISEPTGGSDPARAIRTTATRDGDIYRINGHKMWASGADTARYGIVYARTDREPGAAGSARSSSTPARPGMTVTAGAGPARPLDHRARPRRRRGPGGEPASARRAQGFALAQEWLVRGRLRYAAQAVGVAEEAVRLAIEWARTRETFGALLATRQAVQFAARRRARARSTPRAT